MCVCVSTVLTQRSASAIVAFALGSLCAACETPSTGADTQNATDVGPVIGCTLPGQQAITDYDGKWGEIGMWCDAEALEEIYPNIREAIPERYPGLIVQARRSPWEERQPVIAKMVSLVTVSAHIALAERGFRDSWSAPEVAAFTRAAVAVGFVESYFSQYKMVEGRLQLMRGDQGHSHGLMQIHDRWHNEAVFERNVGWDLLSNAQYGVQFYLDQWQAVKDSASEFACLRGDDNNIDMHALSRSAYSVYNSGNTAKACRWTDGADAFAANDTNYEDRYQKLSEDDLQEQGWVIEYGRALEDLQDIDVAGILELASLPGVVCGDGVLASGEACDDGNDSDGDGCTTACAVEEGYTCGGEPSTCATSCGDGVTSGDEACDDGNTVDGDGCNAGCGEEHGFDCGGTPSICSSSCGDGLVASDENCDDGNVLSGDGCGDCAVEIDFTCTADEPSACTADPIDEPGGGSGGAGSGGSGGADTNPAPPPESDDPADDDWDGGDGGLPFPSEAAASGPTPPAAPPEAAACTVSNVGGSADRRWALFTLWCGFLLGASRVRRTKRG